jgi:C2H2-type zinc finger
MVLLVGFSTAGHVAPAAAPTARTATPELRGASAPIPLIGNATATAKFTNSFLTGVSPFIVLPFNVTWTETEVNATINGANPSNTSYSGGNVTMWLNLTTGGVQAFSTELNGSDFVSCSSAYVCTFSVQISTLGILGYMGLVGASQLPAGEYTFNLTSLATNQSALLPVFTPSYAGATTNLAPYPAFGQFLQPVGNQSAGTLTIAGNFSGYYLTSATVTVTNSTNGEVFSSGVLSSAPNREYAFAVDWTVTTAGAYHLTLELTEQWGATSNFTSEINVTAAVANTHTYSNSTWGIPGFGPGGTAAVLVTLGVIIGIIVMALVGRSLWGGTKPAAAQPWSGEKPAMTPGPGGTFECSVCHQTFPTEDALKEHAKSQHGITM